MIDSSEPKSISDISENTDANELNIRYTLKFLEYLGIVHSESIHYYSMNEFFIRWREANQLRESLSPDELQEKYRELKSADENFSDYLGLDSPLQASQSIESDANLQEWYEIRQQLKHVEWAIEA